MKVNANSIASLVKFILALAQGGYVDEWLEFHAESVNPKELTVTPAWFEECIKNIGSQFPLFSVNATQIAYDRENVLPQLRPLADQCRFISVPELVAVGKNKERLEMCESIMRANRLQTEQVMTTNVSKRTARGLLRDFEHQVVRLAFNKTQHARFVSGVAGVPTTEKLETMQKSWVRVAQSKFEALSDLASRGGIALETPSADEMDEATHKRCYIRE